MKRKSRFTDADPNYAGLYLTPTGRPLRRGSVRYANHWIFVSSLAFGVTENLSGLFGMSTTGDDDVYFGGFLAGTEADAGAGGVGALIAGAGSESLGMLLASGSLGTRDAHFTATGMVPFTGSAAGEILVVVLGGKAQISESVALLTETYILVGGGGSETFSTGCIRFFGKKTTFDPGLVYVDGIALPIIALSRTWN